MSTAPQSLREGWAIQYDCPLRDVPPALLSALLARLQAVADELANIDEASGVWNIVRSRELHLEVGGWRFACRVTHPGLLAVVGAHPISPGRDCQACTP